MAMTISLEIAIAKTERVFEKYKMALINHRRSPLAPLKKAGLIHSLREVK
jgi:hypothetical protein